MKRGFILFVLILLIPGVYGLDQVLVNSEHWQDVYAGMLYASLEEAKGSFLLSAQDGIEKALLVDTAHPDTLLVEDAKKPIVVGYGTSLAQQGLIVEKVVAQDATAYISLAKRWGGNKFIIVDDSYGYNAVSAAPYAVRTKSFVLFVNKETLTQVDFLLREVQSPQILIFGHIIRDAQEMLEPYNPETINEQDRFLNNLAISQRMVDTNDVSQVTFSNGEFLEPSLFFGDFPTVFIGQARTPPEVKEFVINNNIQSGVLVGNSLLDVMRGLRDELGISVFIRFSQGKFNEVRALDLFPVPVNQLQLSITNIYYDLELNRLIVTYKNDGPSFLYFRSSISLFLENELLRRIGDETPAYLESEEIKSVSYDLGDMEKVNKPIVAEVTALYGDSPLSQEFILTHVASVNPEEFRDDSKLRLVSLVFHEEDMAFYVEVENVGPIDTYVHVELHNVNIGGQDFTLTTSGSILVETGAVRTIKIPANLLPSDYKHNKELLVSAQYGKESSLLIYDVSEEMELQFVKRDKQLTYVFILVGVIGGLLFIILLLMLLIFLSGRKKRKQEQHHGHHARGHYQGGRSQHHSSHHNLSQQPHPSIQRHSSASHSRKETNQNLPKKSS